MIDYARQKADFGCVEISVSYKGEKAIFVDSHLMRQALLNIVLNAIDAAKERLEDKGKVSIVSDTSCDGIWSVTIKDNGGGISEDDLEKIFDPFFTTKDEGTGLGLAVVHSIVSAHDGRIDIVSNGSSGAEITIEIPSAPVAVKQG